MEINNLIKELVTLAIKEDIGDGDHTTLACIPPDKTGEAILIVKDNGILAGVEIAKFIFNEIDNTIEFEKLLDDGTQVKHGDKAFKVRGSAQSLLSSERLALNVMQRMSGVATQSNIYAQKLNGLKTKVLDTRKTTPGMRMLDKMAVKIGGGENHRIGLFDMILIKDNHIDFAGGISNAIKATLKYLNDKGLDLKIEVEARSIEEVNEILTFKEVHRILLDNFSIEETKQAVDIIGDKAETESSGGITLDTLRDYAECGVDYISVGALTHQIKSLDMSLKANF